MLQGRREEQLILQNGDAREQAARRGGGMAAPGGAQEKSSGYRSVSVAGDGLTLLPPRSGVRPRHGADQHILHDSRTRHEHYGTSRKQLRRHRAAARTEPHCAAARPVPCRDPALP